jgi:hypothetical protein
MKQLKLLGGMTFAGLFPLRYEPLTVVRIKIFIFWVAIPAVW